MEINIMRKFVRDRMLSSINRAPPDEFAVDSSRQRCPNISQVTSSALSNFSTPFIEGKFSYRNVAALLIAVGPIDRG
jgi:hypothetical protein